MSKYIIKNCPATYLNFESKYVCTTQSKQKEFPFYCQDCTDCVMKRIVEVCKQTCRKRCTNDCLGTKKHCGYGQILKLLDMQEVE